MYRARELSRDPLPLSDLRFSNAREEAATGFVENSKVKVASRRPADDGSSFQIEGTVTDRKDETVSLTVGSDEQILEGQCSCNFFQQNKMRKGPCEHMLALRMRHNQKAKSSLFARLLG